MQFSTKDLMITVLPKTGASAADLPKGCLVYSNICIGPTFAQTPRFGFANACVVTMPCPYDSWTTIFCTPFRPGSQHAMVINDREDLVALRGELQEALKQLDELEEKMPLTIASKAEAEALERGLKEVIQQVSKAAKGLK